MGSMVSKQGTSILKSHSIEFFLSKRNEERREEYRLICFGPEMSLCVNVLNSETNYGGFSNTADFLSSQLYLEGVINDHRIDL